MARPSARYLSRAVRTAVREAVWLATCRHEQGDEPNILLFATRRGGSTFAMELIAANRGIRPLNQPLETQAHNITMAQALDIPLFHQGQITSLDDISERRLHGLMDRIFAGEVVINAPTRFWRSDVEFRSNRLVLKLMDCKAVIGWFDATFDVDIVYLTRHPIPQALSCIRNQWTLTADAYLRDPLFVEAFLSDDALALAHDTLRGDDLLAKFVVNWALENAAPAQLLASHPEWTHLRYEDCVTDPTAAFRLLADRLRLSDVDRMERVLHRPSQSSTISTPQTRREISEGRGAATVTAWRESIGTDVERRTDAVLETFGIDPQLVRSPHR